MPGCFVCKKIFLRLRCYLETFNKYNWEHGQKRKLEVVRGICKNEIRKPSASCPALGESWHHDQRDPDSVFNNHNNSLAVRGSQISPLLRHCSGFWRHHFIVGIVGVSAASSTASSAAGIFKGIQRVDDEDDSLYQRSRLWEVVVWI